VTEIDNYRLTFPIVFNYTVPIKWDGTTLDDTIGAGVLLAHKGRLFVISAAHCIDKSPVVLEQDALWPVAEYKIPVLRRETHGDLDIGFLEVDDRNRRPILSRGTSSLDQIWLPTPPEKERLNIVGFPVDRRRFVTEGEYYFEKRIFCTDFEKSEDNRYFLDYPEKGYTWNGAIRDYEETGFHRTPKGFSGGGCWGFLLSRTDELFNPERHIRLYAIQSAWLPKSRKTICIPIIHFLTMLHSCYPEFQDELLSRFPALAFHV
jgi:hypothetical protein